MIDVEPKRPPLRTEIAAKVAVLGTFAIIFAFGYTLASGEQIPAAVTGTLTATVALWVACRSFR